MSKTPSQKYRLKKLFMGYSRNFYVSTNLFYQASSNTSRICNNSEAKKFKKKSPGQRIKSTNEIK